MENDTIEIHNLSLYQDKHMNRTTTTTEKKFDWTQKWWMLSRAQNDQPKATLGNVEN